jgi:hypothetical protein
MANYYELLNVSPESSPAEIETAIDEQYQKWNQLVTHHEPEVALKASQGKQLLQRIRETLLNKEKRKAYDEGLGLGETVGALMDPDAILQTFGVPMSASKQGVSQDTRETAIRTDAWMCPSCTTPNPIDTLFCEKCGIRIAIPCPQCNKLSELSKTFCRACGADKDKVFTSQKESFIQALVEKQQALLERKKKIENDDIKNEPLLESSNAERERNKTIGIYLLVLGLVMSLFAAFIEPFFLILTGFLVILGFSFFLSGTEKTDLHNEKQQAVTELIKQLQQYDARIEKIRLVSYKDSPDVSYEKM